MSTAHSIELLTGRMFDYDEPTPDMIHVEDIALALSNIARFGGHTRPRLSVAEHAKTVYWIVRDAGASPDVCFAALHHDSSEAYLGDLPTPLKRKFELAAPGVYRGLVAAADRAIGSAFGIDPVLFHAPEVKRADALAMAWEAAILKPSGKAQTHNAWVEVAREDVPRWAVHGESPEDAEVDFLACHQVAASW